MSWGTAGHAFDAHDTADVWPDLHLEYISNRPLEEQGDNGIGWYHGLPVDDAAKYHNPWVPVRREELADFDY